MNGDEAVTRQREWLHRHDTNTGVPYAGFRDPVGGAAVSIGSDWGTQAQVERVAELFYQTALTHWLTVAEIHNMAVIAIHGAEALEDDFDCMREIEDCIYQAKRDAQRLRKMRQQGGSIEQIVEIMERNREGLLRLMKLDPARAEEIRAFLEGSQERVRKMVMEHRREVRQQRQGRVN